MNPYDEIIHNLASAIVEGRPIKEVQLTLDISNKLLQIYADSKSNPQESEEVDHAE